MLRCVCFLKKKSKWLEASLDELQRKKSSLHRQYHEPLVYQAAVDLDYRALVLEQAFSAKSQTRN